MKVTSGFIGQQILNFERKLSLSPDHKAVLFRLASFLFSLILHESAISFFLLHRHCFLLINMLENGMSCVLEPRRGMGISKGPTAFTDYVCHCFV
jgi:hypothetical protein